MRRLFFFIFVLLSFSLFAQKTTIILETEGKSQQPVQLAPPVKGNYFIGNIFSDTTNEKGILEIHPDIKTPSPLGIRSGKVQRLFIRPGGNYHILIQGSNAEKPFTITGPDAEAQTLLQPIGAEFFQSKAMKLLAEDIDFEEAKSRLLTEMDSTLRPFRVLKEEGKLADDFYTYARQLATNYYATTLASFLSQQMGNKVVFHPDSSGYDADLLRKLDNQWKAILQMAPLHSPLNKATDTYYYYTFVVHGWYLNYYLQSRAGNYQIPRTREESADQQYNTIRKHYEGELKEFQLATHISESIMQKDFAPAMPRWFGDFKNSYPNSVYTSYLESGVAEVNAYLQKAKSDFSAEQHFVQQPESVSSMDQLAERFKGKTVYVDLWATWCGPCKEEFKHNPKLKDFFGKKGIEALYISIDKPTDERKWKEMIKYYDLRGHHILATPELMNDIRQVFGNKGALSIPRYAIIKDGKLVHKSAPRPGETRKLFHELEKWL